MIRCNFDLNYSVFSQGHHSMTVVIWILQSQQEGMTAAPVGSVYAQLLPLPSCWSLRKSSTSVRTCVAHGALRWRHCSSSLTDRLKSGFKTAV